MEAFAILAQTTPAAAEETVITWESLATAAGASVVALILVQFAKISMNLSDGATRKLSAVFGVVLVLVAVLVLNGVDWLELGLGLLVGIQAGLAASKSVEIVRYSFSHQVS